MTLNIIRSNISTATPKFNLFRFCYTISHSQDIRTIFYFRIDHRVNFQSFFHIFKILNFKMSFFCGLSQGTAIKLGYKLISAEEAAL